MVKYNGSIVYLKGDSALTPTFHIVTLGCKVNQYESEAIAERMREAGFADADGAEADVYIINTCTVTGESDRKCGQMIRKAAKTNPDAALLVVGCFSQVSPDAVANIKGVDYVGGSAGKLNVAKIALDILKKGKRTEPELAVTSLDGVGFEDISISAFGRTRAYIKIEDGCNNRCSYCIIPTARGRVRSKAPADIIDEINTLCTDGCKEIVLTGIETDAYGLDLDSYRLADLADEICEKTAIERIRFGSLDPTLFTEEFTERICKNPRILPHFHISMQSGSSSTLAAMRRRYNAKMAHEALARIRRARPDVQFSADFIVGFPGESDEAFAETLEFIKAERFITLHVFQYSKRKGTEAAARKDQIPPEVKKARSETLISEQRRIRGEIFSGMTGTTLPLLVERTLTEKDGSLYALGHTPSFVQMKARLKHEHTKNDIVDILVTSHDADCIFGEEI